MTESLRTAAHAWQAHPGGAPIDATYYWCNACGAFCVDPSGDPEEFYVRHCEAPLNYEPQCSEGLVSGVDEWFVTVSGKQFFPMDPRVEDIDIDDIAWALSILPRWGGHSREVIPVAQHSVIVSDIVPRSQALVGLMHDATEAYMGADLISPIKRHCPNFCRIEAGLWQAIRKRYDLGDITPEIKRADRVSLSTEKRDHIAHNPRVTWPFDESHPALPTRVVPWGRHFARSRFLERFHELTEGAYE